MTITDSLMDVTLARNLYKWAYNKPENRSSLEDWLEAAVLALVEGKGKDVISTSANGVSVAFQSSSMTTADWFSTLNLAITYLDTRPVTKITGRVC